MVVIIGIMGKVSDCGDCGRIVSMGMMIGFVKIDKIAKIGLDVLVMRVILTV